MANYPEYLERNVFIERIKKAYCDGCENYNGVKCHACGIGDGVLLDNKGQLLCHTVGKTCSNCKWHDRFSWVCYNGLSECRADFTDPDDVCKEWEKRDETSADL